MRGLCRSKEIATHRSHVVCVSVIRLHCLRVVGVDLVQADMGVASCCQKVLVCGDLELVDLQGNLRTWMLNRPRPL